MLHQTYTTPFLPRSKQFRIPGLPRPLPHRYRVDPLAFVGALVLAPLIPALVLSPLLLGGGGWMILPLVAIAAVYLGGIPYLLFGIPALLYLLPRHGPRMDKITSTAIAVVFGMTLVGTAIIALSANGDLFSGLFIGVVAMVFALIWSSLFVVLFRKFERSAYRARNGH